MPSPFPGMDPYVEASGLWGDFHYALIYEIKMILAAGVPSRYLVRTEERSYVVLVESEERASDPFLPDVIVTSQRTRKKTPKKAGAAVAEPAHTAEPHVLCAFIEEEHHEAFIEIYEADSQQRLITAIEVLSPSNKRPASPGWDLYQRKRQSLFLAHVNLVEIDLLRGGQRMPMLDPWPDSPYTLLVAPAGKPQSCLVWEGHFQRPLPAIRVPLARPGPAIPLSLQPLIDTIYQRFRYDRSIDYRVALSPQPGEEEAAWIQQQLRAHSGQQEG